MNNQILRQATSPGDQKDSEYSWPGVIDFLVTRSKEMERQETEWLLDKQELQQANSELEARVSAQESLNEDLMRRIKMLEYSLKRERVKFVALLNKNNVEDREKLLGELRKEEAMPAEVEEILAKQRPELVLPKKRAKKAKDFLSKIMKQFDCSDILD